MPAWSQRTSAPTPPSADEPIHPAVELYRREKAKRLARLDAQAAAATATIEGLRQALDERIERERMPAGRRSSRNPLRSPA